VRSSFTGSPIRKAVDGSGVAGYRRLEALLRRRSTVARGATAADVLEEALGAQCRER
jgi:hypothetical protein